jgi:hypothetical protein
MDSLNDICYGDNVRIRRTPETERLGIADAIGNVYGETTPSESQVEVIGEPRSDHAFHVYFDSLQKSYWLTPGMLEFVDHAPGTEVHVHGTSFKSVRQRDGSWKEVPIGPAAEEPPPGHRDSRRYLIALVAPLVVQVLAYVVVFVASRGGGSFMGLLAIPVAALAIPALVAVGVSGARGTRPLGGVALKSFGIALGPPILLLVFRALES